MDVLLQTYDAYIRAYQQSKLFWEGRARSLDPQAEEQASADGGPAQHQSDDERSGEAEETEDRANGDVAGEPEAEEDVVREDGLSEAEKEDFDEGEQHGGQADAEAEHSGGLIQPDPDLDEEQIEYE